MRIAGIVLIVIQCLVTIISLIAGSNPFSGGFFGTIGYFLCGIIGIILLIVAAVKKNKSNNQDNHDSTVPPKNHTPNPPPKTHSDSSEIENFINELENIGLNGNEYKMNDFLKEKYTRMFKQPFSQVFDEENVTIKNHDCAVYTFHTNYANSFIGAFHRLFVVKDKTPRYFAVEFSFDKTFVLCEWIFEGEKERNHINYGEVFSMENINSYQNSIKKIEEILN